ncbi:MAG: O-antigen ligase family protein [Kiritimatiellia bacterium]
MVEGLIRCAPVLLVFLTVAAFSWIYGGAQAKALVATMPWLWAFLLEALLFFPQCRQYEHLFAARRRVWRGLARDPLFYLTLSFLVVILIPFVNPGLCPACDYPAILGGADPRPPVPFFPFCVNRLEHYGVVQWFVPSLTAMLAVRHALSRAGKRMLMEMMVWNSAALAVFGFIQQATGAESVFWEAAKSGDAFFSVFGYVNMGGAFFVLMFAFSIGLWQYRVVEVVDWTRRTTEGKKSQREGTLIRWIRAHYALVPAVLNFFAVLATLCRAAIICVTVLAVLAFLYYEVSLVFSRHDRARRIKGAAVAAVGAGVFLIFAFVFAPKDLGKEVGTISSLDVLDRVSGKGQYHTRVATEIFKAHPLFGVGGWGYRHFCMAYMTKDELKQLQKVGGANVHNDYMQFLCEHGVVGLGCLVGIFACLLFPLCRDWCKLSRAAQFMKPDKAPPKPRTLYSLPAGAFWILMGNVALLVHAFGDCPMRSAAVLSSFFVSMACAPGYLPRDLEEASEVETAK